MRQRSGHAQFEFTADRFSCDTVHSYPTIDFRHNGLSTTLTGNTDKQNKYTNIPVVENRSFTRNKGRFLCSNIYGQQKYPVGNVFGNIGCIK